MFQSSYLEPNNFSWEVVCQTIVNTIGQGLDVDILVLYFWDLQTQVEDYYFYQKKERKIKNIDSDILLSTIQRVDKILITNKINLDSCAQNESQRNQQIHQAYQQANIVSSICIPLNSLPNFTASLTLHRCQENSIWQQQEIKLAEIMVTQASLALEQALAREQVRALAQREITINRIMTAIRSSLEPRIMFDAIVKELGSALKVDGCTLSLWTKNERFVKCVGLYNPQETVTNIDNNPSLVPIADNPILQQILKTKKPVLSNDLVQQQDIARHELPLHAKSRALLIVPLVVNSEIIGSITLRQSASSRQWNQSDIELTEVVAAQAALAISQVLAHEQLRTFAHRESTINRITKAIRSSLEPRIMFAAIVRELGQALKVDGCTLSLWTKADLFVQCVGLYNPHEVEFNLNNCSNLPANDSKVPIADNPILQRLLTTKKPVLSNDLTQQQEIARHELPLHAKSRALLVVPLIVEREVTGSITLRQSASSRYWNQADIELAEAVAAQAAIAVQQARLYETTRKQSERLKISEQQVKDLNIYLTDSILKRFLPESIVNKAATGELVLELNPETQRVTILFCDLVGFTNLSCHLGTLILAELLNDYLEVMTQAVFEQGGTVDKFIGDAIMALFGAPKYLSHREQAKKAIATAQLMHHYLKTLNQKWRIVLSSSNLPPLQMRCGIHQGRALVGMFGGRYRKDYTAIGNVVNIAARLQEYALPDSILVSQAVAFCLEDSINYEVKLLQLKGIEHNFQAYSIVF